MQEGTQGVVAYSTMKVPDVNRIGRVTLCHAKDGIAQLGQPCDALSSTQFL